MDSTLADKLTQLAGKTQAFSRLEPEQIPVREITAAQIAAVMALVCDRPDINVPQLARAVAPKCARLKWPVAFQIVDSPDSLVLSSEGTAALLLFLYGISPSAVHQFLARKWNTLSLQTDLVAAAAQTDLTVYGVERVVTEGPLASHPLNFRPLIVLVLDAVCREPPSEIVAKTFLDTHVKFVPELFLVGGMYMAEPWPRILERILVNLFAIYFSEAQEVEMAALSQIKTLNPAFLYNACVDLYTRDAAQLDRIVVTAHSLGLVDQWLENPIKQNYSFTLEVIAALDRLGLGSAKDMLVSKFITLGQDAVVALLFFVELKIAAVQGQHPDHNILTLRTVAAFETLTAFIDVPPDHVEQLRALQIQCLQVYPRLINFGQGHDDAILANNDLPTFPADVEQEMKMWFQKMYEQQIEIRDVIAMLEKLKVSDVPRDQDLFACMTHSLFDEYRFFPEYPVNALATTAVLFGSLIHFQLIDNIPLSVALRFILESLRQPVESNMFRFGLQALFELRQRLSEFPKYCSVLLSIPGLASQQQFYQQIKDIVYTSNSLPQVENNTFKSLSASGNVGSFEKPSDAIKDKVLFVVNNLSPANVRSKSKELIVLLDQRFHAWFANYVIGERAIQEPNYHQLYITMLKAINSQNLIGQCCQVLYLHVISIINSADVLAHEKRTELKNLGSFLGAVMLGNNKPILHNNINLKLLLAEATQRELLPAVVPFVCKILSCCAESQVFAPPNAWLMGIMGVLSELYAFGNLKLQLKFEIEVLCNALSLKIENIEPSNFVRNAELIAVESEMAQVQIGTPPSTAGVPSSVAPSLESLTPASSTPVASAALPALPTASAGAAGATVTPAAGPSQFQLVGSTEFVTHPRLRQLFEAAISKTIQDVLLPVVERSASIASFTTKELVTKDFALEADEQKMQMAAHNLSSVLAMSMSLVSVKDPFIEALATELQDMLVANGYGDHMALLDQIPIAARDNTDVIVPLVENAAREKATADVDEALMPSYILRQRFHAQAGLNDKGFSDQLHTAYPLHLPDPLALKSGGLTPQQFSIYEEFSLEEQAPVPVEVPEPAALEQTVLAVQEAVEHLEQLVKSTEFSPDGPVGAQVKAILQIVNSAPSRDEVILRASQVVVSAMFQPHSTQRGQETLCYLLVQLCNLSSATAKEVVLWLIYSDDERKFNVQVMGTLIKAKLVTATELDVNLAKEISEGNEATTNFVAGLILDSVLGETPYCLRSEFTASLEAMQELDSPVAQGVLQALRDTRGDGWTASDATGDADLKDKMGYVFAEWTQLAQRPSASLYAFVYEMNEHKLLSNQEPLFVLIRTALQASVESYASCVELDLGISEMFIGVDSLAKLVVVILETNGHPLPEKLKYANSILLVVLLVLAQDHDTSGFAAQPYFRFFSSLLYEISCQPRTEFWNQLLLAVGAQLEVMQPLALPAFTSSWIALISHRHFMNRLLNLPGKQGWPLMYSLLVQLFDFLVTYSNGKYQSESTVLTYQGVVTILAVILADFPLFFVEYAYGLCNALPASFTQAQNIILCASPVPLVNPLGVTSSSPIDYSLVPPIAPEFDIPGDLSKLGLLRTLEQATKAPTPAAAQQIVAALVTAPKQDGGIDFDTISVSVAGYNAVAVYIAGTLQSSTFDPESAQAQLCSKLLQAATGEARYFLVAAMANQLRYPSVSTHFFSELLLHLFVAGAAQDVQHTVVRVLLERVICNRPHSWGLMATFSQLLKNPACKFWELPFVRVAPEFEQMLKSLYTHLNSIPA